MDAGKLVSVNERSSSAMRWPNEVNYVPASFFHNGSDRERMSHLDALLVCDGFLVPGKDQGGVYLVKNPGNPKSEWTVCLSESNSESDRWFYHRAVWVDLTGDGTFPRKEAPFQNCIYSTDDSFLLVSTGRQSVLTCRARVTTALGGDPANGVTSGLLKKGELLWLEMPKPHSFDPDTGTPLEDDGTIFDPLSSRNLPWKTRVLAKGPDVMYSIADLDIEDDTIEVISSEFFGERVTLHSIQRGQQPRVVFQKVIDAHCGAAFGSILADLDPVDRGHQSTRRLIDQGSAATPPYTDDSSFSHLLVTSHECSYAERDYQSEYRGAFGSPPARKPPFDGGSLFAYRVPVGKGAWKNDPWLRTTVATGFKVRGQLNNMIQPGAPGLVYIFHAKREDAARGAERKRPLIAVAGDCAASAYIFRPDNELTYGNDDVDPTRYKLMVEFQCDSTVGSIGIGYGDNDFPDEESGYAKLYIPCYEKDKILVFSLGSGEDDEEY